MNYNIIRKMDITNGKGIGISVFVQGCNIHCKGCFNSETWDFSKGKQWSNKEVEKVLEYSKASHISRLSILGGEPLDEKNFKEVLNLCIKFKKTFPNKDIWLYSGYDFLNIYNSFRKDILVYIDYLIAGPFVLELQDFTYKWAGSTNQQRIDVQKTLKSFPKEKKIILFE